MSKTDLFSDFSKISDQEWLAKIEQDLKGKSASQIAKKRKYENIDLKVFYTASHNTEKQNINSKSDWRIITANDYLKDTMADPIYHFVSLGNWLNDDHRDLVLFKDLFIEEIPKKNLGIEGSLYQNAGSSAYFELACILSHLNEYLHLLKKHKALKKDLFNKLSIKVSIGSDYFLEIAKLRALRVLVDNLGQAYDLDTASIDVYAENSLMNYSSADVDSNILRSTTACMSAVLGGSDHIIIMPHDMLVNEWHEFGDRIARNIQLLMKHEGHLDKVVDPGSGSYYIEHLTKLLAEKAWASFKDIEKKGGFIDAFKEGYIQNEIQKTADLRREDVRNGETTLIGINKFQKTGGQINRRSIEWDKGAYNALKPLFLEDSAI